jgi:hypothetical protein
MMAMASLTVDDERVVVSLTGLEAVMGLARQVSVPLRDITTVSTVADGLGDDLDVGFRVGGAGVPRRLKFGRFRKLRGGERTFAALYAHQPALVIETSGGDWDRLAITTDDPESDATHVRAAAGLS